MQAHRALQQIDIDLLSYGMEARERVLSQTMSQTLSPDAILMNLISSRKADLLFKRTGIDIEQWNNTLQRLRLNEDPEYLEIEQEF